MKYSSPTIYLFFTTCLIGCSTHVEKSSAKEFIKAEIEEILRIQDDAYDRNNEEGRLQLASTCVDSLFFVGGDSGGLATTADYYVHDLADGYIERPHDRRFAIYDHTVIVSSLHQSFKVFNKDTIYFNVRSSKIFVRQGKHWKMAFVTYAPLPINYTKPVKYNATAFSEYAGLYEGGSSQTDTVSVVNGKVYLASVPAPQAELIPLNDSTFIGSGYVGKTVFSRNKAGKVTHSHFEFPDGQRIKFQKLK
jgi:hypothetical protein